MVANYRVWMALGFGLLGPCLAPGCRDFSTGGAASAGGGQGAAPSSAGDSGAIGDVSGAGGAAGSPVDPAAGADGESGGAGSAGDGNPSAGTAGDAGSELDFSGRTVVVEPIDAFGGDKQWTHVVPFVHDGAPHFVAYSAGTGNVSFRRLDQDREHSTLVWSGQWEPGLTAISRVTPGSEERLALYRAEDGTRRLVTFQPSLQGELDLLDASEWTIPPGFTHHASDIQAPIPVPYLFWYATSGDFLVEMLNGAGTQVSNSYPSMLAADYLALAAIDGRLLGFHATSLDIFNMFDQSALDESPAIVLSGLSGVQRVVAFKLADIPLLFVYDLIGKASVLELAWTKDQARFQELAHSGTIGNALSVTGLSLLDEQLIFLHDSTSPALQVISIALAPLEL